MGMCAPRGGYTQLNTQTGGHVTSVLGVDFYKTSKQDGIHAYTKIKLASIYKDRQGVFGDALHSGISVDNHDGCNGRGGSREKPPPFGGPPNFIKRENPSRVCM